MLSRRQTIALAAAATALPHAAVARLEDRYRFASIDGGEIVLGRGRPALVVNTASQCGFTPQYDGLQALHEAWGDRVTVLAVPSDDFGGQELSTEAEVKEFCAVNFSLTLPMTEITRVTGQRAHPFYVWAAQQGVRPGWNFHKILIDAEGQIAADFRSGIRPESAALQDALRGVV